MKLIARFPIAASVWSVALFALGFQALIGWPQALGLTAFLVAHELGHVTALRLYGMRTMWIVFLPFMGAVTAHDSYPENGERARMIVASAGLITGLAVIPLLILAGHQQVAGWALGLTAINLLPAGGLDGGHIYRWAKGALTYPRMFRSAMLIWASVGLLGLLAA